MATQGGPGVNVVVDTTRARAAGPALPVAVMPDGYPVEGDAALAVYVAPAGAIVQGGPAIPVVVAAAGSRVEGGAAIPIVVVRGVLP